MSTPTMITSQYRGFLAQDRQIRAIMGQPLPYGGLMGADSFPGSNTTYTPPKQSIKNLGNKSIKKGSGNIKKNEAKWKGNSNKLKI